MKRRLNQLAILLIIASIFYNFSAENVANKLNHDDYQKAPVFTLQSLVGEHISLSDYMGKVVVLNFWATWCGPCQVEIPILNELYSTYGKDKLMVLGVAINSGSEEKIKKFADDYDMAYPVLYGTDREIEEIVHMYGSFSAIPTTFLINQKGEVTNYYMGAQSTRTFEEGIDHLLNSSL